MNSIERVLAALTFGKAGFGVPDRVPVLPVPLMQGALVHQCTVRDYFRMPAQAFTDAQVALNEMLDGIPDGVAGIPHVVEDVTGFGVPLKYDYENSSPTVGGMLVHDFAELATLNCPDPTSSPDLRRTLDVIGQLRRRIGDEKVVIGAAIAPFSLPSMLMGTAKWMRLLYTEELRRRHLDRVLAVCSQYVVRWAKAQLNAGAHVIVLADGMASATIIPRRIFAEHAAPVTKQTIKEIGGLVAYEPVGTIEPFVELTGELGAVAVLIGEEDDIATCKRRLAGKAALIGNVNNMKLRRWSPARVELQAKSALAAGMPGYGFALANQGPEIPFDVSPAAIAALVKTVERYGRYASAGTSRAAA